MGPDRYRPRLQAPAPAYPLPPGELGPNSPEEEFARRHPQPLVAVAELERAARRVVGVHSCRVLRQGEEPLPQRVRVVVQAARRLGVAKDIQSAWFSLWNLYVPRSLFAVTAIRSPRDLGPDRGRLQLVQCALSRSGATLEVGVTLYAAGREFDGRSAAAAAGADPVRLAAAAALVAVEAATGRGGWHLLELRRLRVAGANAVLCAVGTEQGQVLLGVGQVRSDEREAAVRAVLNALNRRMAP